MMLENVLHFSHTFLIHQKNITISTQDTSFWYLPICTSFAIYPFENEYTQIVPSISSNTNTY